MYRDLAYLIDSLPEATGRVPLPGQCCRITEIRVGSVTEADEECMRVEAQVDVECAIHDADDVPPLAAAPQP